MSRSERSATASFPSSLPEENCLAYIETTNGSGQTHATTASSRAFARLLAWRLINAESRRVVKQFDLVDVERTIAAVVDLEPDDAVATCGEGEALAPRASPINARRHRPGCCKSCRVRRPREGSHTRRVALSGPFPAGVARPREDTL